MLYQNPYHDAILTVVNRANQRGGRMLSVIDLLNAGTLSLGQLCWLLARILEGSSWLVGARPGGAGKTTVMAALLAMIPPCRIRIARVDEDWRRSSPGDCLVAYEIGQGWYEGYVWGDDLVRMTELGQQGVRIVSNLHADNLAQAREQIVNQCGASSEGMAAFQLFLPVHVRRQSWTIHRIVPQIHHYRKGRWQLVDVNDEQGSLEQKIAAFLRECSRSSLVTIEQVRTAWLDWLNEHCPIQ